MEQRLSQRYHSAAYYYVKLDSDAADDAQFVKLISTPEKC